MAKKKVYAVRKGNQTGLFDTWDACKKAVAGCSGAVYKSFATREEAQAYLNQDETERTAQAAAVAAIPASRRLTAYVDGSFDKKIGRYSFVCILLTPQGETVRESGCGSRPDALALRNVMGEMMGAVCAVTKALELGYEAVNICYDYAGIEQWATHGWQAGNEMTKKYTAFMDQSRRQILITFTKIAAHTGDQYNEEADQLAKQALRNGMETASIF